MITMTSSARGFATVLICGAFLSLASCVSNRPLNSTQDDVRNGFPIVQGLTNKTATQIAIVAPSTLPLRFRYRPDSPKEQEPIAITSVIHRPVKPATGVAVVVHHLVIENLKLGLNYTLEVIDPNGKVLDRRAFQTLDTSPRAARVISASCMYDGFLKEAHEMWPVLVGAKPDLLLLIGDNVYAEAGGTRFKSPLNEEALWIRYNETFQVLDFYRTPDLIPTIVTWDDHDYGMQDGNATNPHKLDSKRTLEAFFAQTPSPAFPEFTTGPGVSSRLDAFGYRFLLLDDRSFRGETHFGAEQERWLFEQAKASRTPVWLISGDQWFGAYHRFESYEGRQPASFKRFLHTLRKVPQPILFMSGDRHLSEVMRIEKTVLGYETYEVTSSALHSRMYPGGWDKFPNPRQVRGVDLQPNFNLFELTPAVKNHVQLKGSAIGPAAKELYSFNFEITRASKAAH